MTQVTLGRFDKLTPHVNWSSRGLTKGTPPLLRHRTHGNRSSITMRFGLVWSLRCVTSAVSTTA